jgi:hypothetical protein
MLEKQKAAFRRPFGALMPSDTLFVNRRRFVTAA